MRDVVGFSELFDESRAPHKSLRRRCLRRRTRSRSGEPCQGRHRRETEKRFQAERGISRAQARAYCAKNRYRKRPTVGARDRRSPSRHGGGAGLAVLAKLAVKMDKAIESVTLEE